MTDDDIRRAERAIDDDEPAFLFRRIRRPFWRWVIVVGAVLAPVLAGLLVLIVEG